jgi:hypothetical protein
VGLILEMTRRRRRRRRMMDKIVLFWCTLSG